MSAKKDKQENDIKQESTMTLEEAFAALDDLIDVMEDEKISLEDSFNSYKKGLELIKMCDSSISRIEGELEILESEESGK